MAKTRFTRIVKLYDQKKMFSGQDNAVIFTGEAIYQPNYMKFSTKRGSTLCDHPIEDGSLVTDHKIILPREFTLTVAMPEFGGADIIATLERYFEDSEKIMVECATGIYPNMILTDIPTSITPNNLSRPLYDLSFREILIVGAQMMSAVNFNTSSPEDSNTEKATAYASEVDPNSPQGQAALDQIFEDAPIIYR